jgi:hypothetical protein
MQKFVHFIMFLSVNHENIIDSILSASISLEN